MKAKQAMFVWTPNQDLFDKATFPLKGQIAVTTIPESAKGRQHPASFGACDYDWTNTDDAGRKKLAQRLVRELIHHDNIPEADVRKAFVQVEEFADFPFDTAAA